MVKLPSIMKGWFNPALNAEQCMLKFADTNDGKLLSRLVMQFNDDLYHYLLSQSDRHMSEDIVQTVWLKVIEKRHYYQLSSPFKYWLFRIARNCLIDELRRTQRWQFVDIDDAQHPSTLGPDSHNLDNTDSNSAFTSRLTTESLEYLLAMDNQQQRFDFLLEQLPFAQRDAFILQQEGFSIEDIAKISAVKRETIKSRLRYARQYFKRHMELTHGKG